MTLEQLLDAYYMARARKSTAAMIQIADILVEKEIPELIERLAQVTISRNQAQQERGFDATDNLVDCHL